MANITNLLNTIKNAIYGRDMRNALHDSIKSVNDDVETKANKANVAGGFAGGSNASAFSGGGVGKDASTTFGGAVGSGASSYKGFAGGRDAKTDAQDAIQLGTGTNSSEKTLQVYDYQLMDADGHIPNDRMPTKADVNTVYTKTQTDDIIKTKMGTVYKVKGSLGFIGTPISVDDCEIGDVYNIFGDPEQSICWLFNNLDFASAPRRVSVESGHIVGFGLLHLRSDADGSGATQNPPTITLRYNGMSKTFGISHLDTSMGQPLIFTLTDVFEAFGISDYSSVQFMDLMSIENNWIDVPNGGNVVYTEVGWDVLPGVVDMSNYYTKSEIDEELSHKATMQDVQELVGDVTRPYDDTPTAGSENPVTSDGIKTALDEKVSVVLGSGVAEIESSQTASSYGSSVTRQTITVTRNIPKSATEDNSGIDKRSTDFYSADAIEALFYSKDEVERVIERYGYQTKPTQADHTIGGDITWYFPQMYNMFWNYLGADSDITSISVIITDGEYPFDYISSVSFKTGDTPPQVSYTSNSNTLVWVGSECGISNGIYIFSPIAHKVYDIVFYFNGTSFVGLVNGYTLPTSDAEE